MQSRSAKPRVETWGLKPGILAMAAAMFVAGCGGSDSAQPEEPQPPEQKVTIKRDTHGVPHIYADSVRGLYYGFGYAVAEDRLFQMEMARRSVLGTAAEVMGASFLELDKSARQASDVQSVRAQLGRLAQADRDIFDGYAAGFNARVREVLAKKSELMPKEFIDAGFEPQEWSGVDVAMIFIGTMVNRFSNGNSEVANLQLLDQLKAAKGEAVGKQLFDQLRWLEDSAAPTTVPRAVTTTVAQKRKSATRTGRAQALHLAKLAPVSPSVFQAVHAADAARKGITAPEDRPVASNAWVVGADKTTDGSTIFINGPQFGWVNPAYVYSIGLHGAGFDVTGNTPFGYPAILFGTNGKISWGSTAGPLDVNDTYQYRLNPSNQYEYFHNGAYRAMAKTTEVIKVKGEADRTLDIYATVHGRVTSFDMPNGTAYALKRSWEGYEVQTLLAWIQSTKAQNWNEWLDAARKFAITNNWYYADTRGNIGYASPGFLPIRPASQDIRLPALGDGSMEWQGIRPFSDNPKVFNPSQGYIANWNNQSAPGVQTDGGNYSAADRVNELKARLEVKAKLTPDEIWKLNESASFADVNARYFVPMIVEATAGLAETDPLRQAAQTLAAWDFENRSTVTPGVYDGSATTIFRSWLSHMYRIVLQDDLPPAVYASRSSAGYPGATTQASTNVSPGTKLVYNALMGPRAGVPQTVDFLNGEDRDSVIRRGLSAALEELTTRFGADQAKWLTAVTRHDFQPRNFMGYPQAGVSEVPSLPVYMNRGTQNHRVTFASGGAASLCTVTPPGQSGFISPSGAKSKHYDDQMELYRRFECKPEWLTERDVDANRESVLVLRP